jgi:hypothetical protein
MREMRDWVSKAVVAVMVAILLSGCNATLPEIRAKEPSYTLTSIKPPQELSKCIEFKMREWWGRLIVNREEHENNTYRVVLSDNMVVFADILVKPKDNGSMVEFRRRGAPVNQSDWLEIIERCAK